MQPKVPQIKMPGLSKLQLNSPIAEVSLNPAAFEDLIKSQGIRMFHSRPVPCPKVRDLTQPDHPISCPLCFNGYIYYGKTEFTGAFAGNRLDRKFGQYGTWDFDSASIICPVYDSQGQILDLHYFDQILIPDFSVRYYQRVEHDQSGIDRPQFRVLDIDYVIDATGKEYRVGVDVIAEDGRIKWIGERPGYNVQFHRGIVYSINYYTNPVFSVIQLPHQLRMAQTQVVGSNNIPARFPQLVVVQKDFIPFSHEDHKGEPDRPEPPDGSFGPGPHGRAPYYNV